MKFIYLTAKKYPGSTADHHYVRNLAYAFFNILKDDFIFTSWNTEKESLKGLPMISIHVPNFIKLTLVFLFKIPIIWFNEKRSKNKVVFFSNDINLLILLVFWKKILPIIIISDWYMLYGGFRDSFVLKNSDLCITTSKKLEDSIKKVFSGSKTKVVYGGIDLGLYEKNNDKNELRSILNLPKDKFLIGYVGLFTTFGIDKGISTMIDSIVGMDDNFRMVFVGGRGDEVKVYESLAKDKKVLDRCIFLPMQTFENVVRYEKSMDVLIIPYPDKPHFRNYGFPMKLYEYMASGVPIVYTKLELVEEVASGCAYGISPDNSSELRNVIHRIKELPEEANKKAKDAKNLSMKLTWDAKAFSILEAIRGVIK